jgi:hypothetical protein
MPTESVECKYCIVLCYSCVSPTLQVDIGNIYTMEIGKWYRSVPTHTHAHTRVIKHLHTGRDSGPDIIF